MPIDTILKMNQNDKEKFKNTIEIIKLIIKIK